MEEIIVKIVMTIIEAITAKTGADAALIGVVGFGISSALLIASEVLGILKVGPNGLIDTLRKIGGKLKEEFRKKAEK